MLGRFLAPVLHRCRLLHAVLRRDPRSDVLDRGRERAAWIGCCTQLCHGRQWRQRRCQRCAELWGHQSREAPHGRPRSACGHGWGCVWRRRCCVDADGGGAGGFISQLLWVLLSRPFLTSLHLRCLPFQNFAKYLPLGIGKPFAGRTFTLLGGCFDMGDLGRVLDVVAKVRSCRSVEECESRGKFTTSQRRPQGADLVYRFDLYLGPNAETFGNLLKYLGARVTKQLSGNTTHAVSVVSLSVACAAHVAPALCSCTGTPITCLDPSRKISRRR